MPKPKPEPKHYCSECGKRRDCAWNWHPGGWVWTCWDCLDADEDGYAVMLT